MEGKQMTEATIWGCADYNAEGCENDAYGEGDNCPAHGGHTPEQSATHRAGGECDNSGCAA